MYIEQPSSFTNSVFSSNFLIKKNFISLRKKVLNGNKVTTLFIKTKDENIHIKLWKMLMILYVVPLMNLFIKIFQVTFIKN